MRWLLVGVVWVVGSAICAYAEIELPKRMAMFVALGDGCAIGVSVLWAFIGLRERSTA